MNTNKIKKEIRKVLAPNKFGVKCPFCSFKPTPYLTELRRKRGVIQHILKAHPEKLPTRENQLFTLFDYAIKQAYEKGLTQGLRLRVVSKFATQQHKQLTQKAKGNK